MFFDRPAYLRALLAPLLLLMLSLQSSCSLYHRAQTASDNASVSLSLPSDEEIEEKMNDLVDRIVTDSTSHDGPIIMNAIRDEESGEMVATDVIRASKVTARFRHAAERLGKVSLEFDINVPGALTESAWQLRFFPVLTAMGDTLLLDPVFITGSRYREAQIRGYRKYNDYVSSIITDSVDFLWARQLRIFLQRQHDAAVSEKQAEEHYTNHLLIRRNDRRVENMGKMYARYVKSPIITDGIRLDTVLSSLDGSLTYRYVQEINSRPGLKKVGISMEGAVHDMDRELCALQSPEPLTFYISSLSGLLDPSEHFMTKVITRNSYDRTLALIDFSQGSARIDTTMGCNASELRRIRRCVEEAFSDEEYEVDSLVVTASCSPEGAYRQNARLADLRAKSLAHYLDLAGYGHGGRVHTRSVPENWELLVKILSNDTKLQPGRRRSLLGIASNEELEPDVREAVLAGHEGYRYLREQIYPMLRTVQLEFYTHRAGMVKDTLHTMVPDTVYMAGVEALRNLDYRTAVELLRPYGDYNTALALTALTYYHSAMAVLDALPGDNPKVLYLKAICLSRLDRSREALDCYRRSAELDPSMVHRANLDPEISYLINKTI